MINWLPFSAGMFNVRVTVTPVTMRLFSPATVRVEFVVSSPALGCPVMLVGGIANGTSLDETETPGSPSSVLVSEVYTYAGIGSSIGLPFSSSGVIR